MYHSKYSDYAEAMKEAIDKHIDGLVFNVLEDMTKEGSFMVDLEHGKVRLTCFLMGRDSDEGLGGDGMADFSIFGYLDDLLELKPHSLFWDAIDDDAKEAISIAEFFESVARQIRTRVTGLTNE